ncbi:hypothetical protein T09_13409, partial [Trichinella sp. T9]
MKQKGILLCWKPPLVSEVFRGKLLEAEDNMNCNMT